MNWFDLAMTVRPLFLVWMAAIFVVIAWRALSPRRRKELQENAMIPLRDDTPRDPTHPDGPKASHWSFLFGPSITFGNVGTNL